jgi:hypothetical protein
MRQRGPVWESEFAEFAAAAAKPDNQLASPLSPQLAGVAGDPRPALFDPPA